MEGALVARDKVGIQDFVLLDETTETAFMENLKKRFDKDLIYVSLDGGDQRGHTHVWVTNKALFSEWNLRTVQASALCREDPTVSHTEHTSIKPPADACDGVSDTFTVQHQSNRLGTPSAFCPAISSRTSSHSGLNASQ
jgi:hypothetical protein